MPLELRPRAAPPPADEPQPLVPAAEPGPTVRAPALLVVAPLISAPGTLTVDDQGLRFERSGGLSGLVAPAAGVSVAADTLSSVRLNQGELVVVAGGSTVRLQGGAVGTTAAILRARGVPAEGGPPDRLQPCFGVVPATLSSGPLQRVGQLAVSRTGLAFAPSGALDLATGTWPLHVPQGKVVAVSFERGTLELRTADAAFAFVNINGETALDLILRMLQPWDGQLRRDPWRCPTVLVEGFRLTPGSLDVAELEALCFTDRAGRRRDLGALQQVFSGEGSNGVPVLDGGRAGWRARLPVAPDPLEALEEEVGRLPPLPPAASERVSLHRLARDLVAVRVRTSDGATRTLRPVVVEAPDSTFDLLLPGSDFVQELVHARLVLTLMTRRQLLRFGSRPWRLEPVDRESLSPRQARALANARRLVRLRLPWPNRRDLEEETNHRKMVRIGMDQTQVQADIGPTRARVRLDDLSGGGARLISRVPLLVDRPVGLRLGLPEIDDPVAGEVAWARRTEHGYVGGVRFLDASEAFQQLMVRYIYRLELLVAKGERRPLSVLAEQLRRGRPDSDD